MKILSIFFLVIFTLLQRNSNCKEICYDDLGCFIDTQPFGGTIQRPLGKLPESPEKIATSFTLFNRRSLSGVNISIDRIPLSYNATVPTKIIIHGLNNNAKTPWVIEMKDALLANENVNVIVVDWEDGSTLPYEQACANTQVVGALTANLIKKLITSKKARAADFHLIGFSLGAHTAGYVGKRVKIGRITGLVGL